LVQIGSLVGRAVGGGVSGKERAFCVGGGRKENITLGRLTPEKNVAKDKEGGSCRELLNGNKTAELNNLGTLAHKKK